MLEATRLAQLVASKVCHDMVGPMNALIQGLEMLKASPTSAENSEAIRYIDHGVTQAWAKLDLFRSALAGGLSGDGDASFAEIKPTAERYFAAMKPDLVWGVGAVVLPRPLLRVTLNLLMISVDCLPKGGVVKIEADTRSGGPELRITAAGPRAVMRPETMACLNGQEPEHGYAGHNIQPALVGILARQAGAEIEIHTGTDRVEIALRSPALRIEPSLAA